MRAGKLRHPVTIQTNSSRPADTYGEQAEEWADTATVWASIEPLSATERMEAKQTHGVVTHKFTMRHRSLTPAQRITFDGRTFNIVAVLNTAERDRELQVMAKEVV